MSQPAESIARQPMFTGRILLTGATGYVGRHLRQRLERLPNPLRCMSRHPDKLKGEVEETTETVAGDVQEPGSLRSALQDVQVAYYLVHSMADTADFAEQDRRAAKHFAEAARDAGVERIIYLGGLGEDGDPKLSPHLRSRHEVGRIFRESGVETIELRASVVIGSGSLSFDLIRILTHRLPVMICPRWLATPTQPIAIDDILAYLVAALDLPREGSRIFEVGCEDVVTYGDLIREYARQKGMRRLLISVPLLTPYLSSLWLGLVTPTTAEVGRHLIEGLRNPTVVTDPAARDAFKIRPMGIREAIHRAIERDERSQPSADGGG